METGIGQARYSFSTILYVTPQKSLESFEGDCRFRLDDGQTFRYACKGRVADQPKLIKRLICRIHARSMKTQKESGLGIARICIAVGDHKMPWR